MTEKIEVVKKERGERSKSQQRCNKKELETKALIFLASNPKATVKDFCKSEGISYAYFTRKCDVDIIYEKTDNIRNKKQEERLKVLEKEFEEQGKHEAFDILHFYDISLVALKETIEHLKNNISNFKNTSDVIRCFIEIGRFQLSLLDKGLVKIPQEEDPYNAVIEHIKQLFEFKVKTSENKLNTNENINNLIDDNANNRATTTEEIYS